MAKLHALFLKSSMSSNLRHYYIQISFGKYVYGRSTLDKTITTYAINENITYPLYFNKFFTRYHKNNNI